MKFIARKGAPNIPLQLIEAQESGNLIFFCGAGVSYDAGLPGFEDLVDKVYANLGEGKDAIEAEALKLGLYDRVLGLLEKRLSGDIVRKAIIKELAIAKDANLQNHKSILQLSRTNTRKPHLVTTNVDHGFLRAGQDIGIKNMIDAAPKLPVPKPHKWSSVVHLHGIINEDDDPNGKQLIFTSGDFGSAYLTERWASRFVTELFSHFTVLFVGYSVNDPVIRYMTDAIAAERLDGYDGFKKPYIFVLSEQSQRTENENIWRAKGIEPVLFTDSYDNLYDSIREWANYVRDGLNAKARIVSKEAPNVPLPPYDQDESVQRLIDVLAETTSPHKTKVTGYPARVFSKLENPPAPIEWLPVLIKKELLFKARKGGRVDPVHGSLYDHLLKPNKISWCLWHWMAHHLEEETLIHWVIDNGSCLHPDLKDIIEQEIKRKLPKEPDLRFWKIMISDCVKCDMNPVDDEAKHIRALNETIDPLTLANFIKLMEPSFQLSKSIDLSALWGDEEDEEQNKNRAPYEVEVVVGLSDYLYEDLKKLPSYPGDLLTLLLPTTQALRKAMGFWNFAGLANELYDRSHWDMASISPHPQNRCFRSWVNLIRLCRDLWEATWKSNRAQAQSVLNIWRSIKYPVFRRLSLHAMTVSEVAEQDVIVQYLLADNGRWLWSDTTCREVFRLLEVLWPKLDGTNTSHLIEKILQGPPIDIDDLTKEKWEYRFKHKIWLMLSKLKSFGRDLPAKASNELEKLVSEHPNWALREDDRDEFILWMETGWGYKLDITAKELFEKDPTDIVKLLSQEDRQYHEGRIDVFRMGCKDRREKAIEVLRYLAEKNNWNKDIWHAGLVGLTESKENSWSEIAPLLTNAPPEFYHEEGWPVAYWTKKNISSVKFRISDENYFRVIFDSLLDNLADRMEPIGEAVNYALNHPVGIITEALIDRFNARGFKANEGIPEGPLWEYINRLITSPKQASFAGKIMLASRLNYFHAIDPAWTEENLIPLFDWEKSELATLMWQGYLWSQRISADLAIALKHHLLNSLKRIENIQASVKSLIQLFTMVCLEYSDLYTAKERHDALVNIGKDGLEYVAEFFSDSIRWDPESADNYWRNRIQPFIQRAWPKDKNFVSEKTSASFSLMLIELDEAFKEALDYLSPFIQAFSDLSYLLIELDKKKQLPAKYPKEVFQLLSKVFTAQYQYPTETFRNVLDRIISANPLIKNEPIYGIINDYLIEHGF